MKQQPSDFSTAISATVAATIRTAGKSQREISEATGIPLVTLSRRLTGRSAFTVLELAAIADAVGVSVTDLVLRAERAERSNGSAA